MLDADSALKLVASFFPQEWATTDTADIQTKLIAGGLNNTLQLVSRVNSRAVIEPAAVLIRLFGQNGGTEEPPATNLTLSAAQQAIVTWEMSRRGWGPKVYGVFAGGRLEEYINSHTLTAEESTNASVSRAVAGSYARLHSLRLPLQRDGFRRIVQDFDNGAKHKREAVFQALRAVEDPVALKYADLFEHFDWNEELDWVVNLFEQYKCKTTITHGDSNYMNILIRNSPAKDQCPVVLVDYETISYGYRGFDIGGHFIERMYSYQQADSQLTGFPIPSVEEQRAFCEAYLQETHVLGQASELDTVEQLLVEAAIGQLYQLLYTNLMCTVLDEVEIEPVFLSGLLHMMEMYEQLKEEFVRTH